MRRCRASCTTAGLGSRDVSSGDLLAVFNWLADEHELKTQPFVVLGINHRLALAPVNVELRPRGAFSLRGHSIGGYGSVTVNKLLASVIGQTFRLYVQAYPRYGSEKRGLPTTYYLTIADEPIRQHSELRQVELVPLYDVAAFGQGDPLAGLVTLRFRDQTRGIRAEIVSEAAAATMVDRLLAGGAGGLLEDLDWAGALDIDPGLRQPWRGKLAGPGLLMLGCALAAFGAARARARDRARA